MVTLVCGVDLGQRSDPTAIIVVEVEKRAQPGEAARLGFAHLPPDAQAQIVKQGSYKGQVVTRDDHYIARHIKRLPLGTPYPEIIERLKEIDEKIAAELQPTGEKYGKVTLYAIDATGVGRPPVDYIKREIEPVRGAGTERSRVIGITITAGNEVHSGGGGLYCPKAELVSMLQVLLQSGRIHLPRTEEAQALKDELLNYEIKVSDAGQDTYGVFKIGKHDDLVTALGLACFYAERMRKQELPIIPVSSITGRNKWRII